MNGKTERNRLKFKSQSKLGYSMSPEKKKELHDDFLVPIGNMIRGIERKAVDHDSHRSIEVLAQCLHAKLDDLRVNLGVNYQESDLKPSVYGENGRK